MIDIVFDGPPGPGGGFRVGGHFIEVERNGKSVDIGVWVHRSDGLWALRITELADILAITGPVVVPSPTPATRNERRDQIEEPRIQSLPVVEDRKGCTFCHPHPNHGGYQCAAIDNGLLCDCHPAGNIP